MDPRYRRRAKTLGEQPRIQPLNMLGSYVAGQPKGDREWALGTAADAPQHRFTIAPAARASWPPTMPLRRSPRVWLGFDDDGGRHP